jgi:ubiquinone/menaquinone biosynthesis C-methylase UbiE
LEKRQNGAMDGMKNVVQESIEIGQNPAKLRENKDFRRTPTRTFAQGVLNIVRFNWHFYILSFLLILFFIALNNYFIHPYQTLVDFLIGAAAATTLISLLVSFYVYDVSNLYTFNWLNIPGGGKMVNINAGFDEVSDLLKQKFPSSDLTVLDFYDPLRHTEISIKRARAAYPPVPNTIKVTTSNLPLPNGCADTIFLILSAHEIRDEYERVLFFKELHRILNLNGQIIVIEHLRDTANFSAYNIGFFHFLPKSSWFRVFEVAELRISNQGNITPFLTTFILEKQVLEKQESGKH